MPTPNEFTAAELKVLYDRAVQREALARYATIPADPAGGPRINLLSFAGQYFPAWGGTAMPVPVQLSLGQTIVRRWPEIYAEVVAEFKPTFKAEVAE